MFDNLPEHSPRGASGAERWINCSGSVNLIEQLKLAPSDEPEYRTEGVRAHAVAAKCLETKTDAWEYMDDLFTEEHAMAVQLYLDTVRPLMFQASSQRIEQKFHRPDLHKDYFGTADLSLYYASDYLLDVTDYKNGAGIVVEVEWNPQAMYYAYGLLDQYPETKRIRLRIVQPRAFHNEGPVREWEISREHLEVWVQEGLLPAMKRSEQDGTLTPGDWCRFCPAKLICPMLRGLFAAAAKVDPSNVKEVTDATLGRDYRLIKGVKFYIHALEEEAHSRLQKGSDMNGEVKLVAKKANRVYKSGAEEVLKARFGEAAYTKPELKSPPQMELVSNDAREVVKEWAYMPLTGTTVALAEDKRAAIKVRTAEEAFGPAITKLLEASDAVS